VRAHATNLLLGARPRDLRRAAEVAGSNRRSAASATILVVKLRLPFDAPLPERRGPRLGVLVMLAVGGLVALLVPIVFGLVLFGMLRGG